MPSRFVFGEAPQRGITYGDVLLDVINAPFTVAVAIEVGDGPAVPLFHEIPIVSKWNLGSGPAHYVGFEMYGLAGEHPGFAFTGITANVKFAAGVWTNYDTSDPLLPGWDPMLSNTLAPGYYTFGFSYDWDRPRGSRTKWWFNGEPIPAGDVAESTFGAESHPIMTNAPFQFSGDFGTSGTESPQGGKALVVSGRIMDDAWHAGFHAEMVARGWR